MANLAELRTAVGQWVARTNLPVFSSVVKLAEEDINRDLRIPNMISTAQIGFSDNSGVLPSNFLEAVAIDIEGVTDSSLELRMVPADRFQRQPEYRDDNSAGSAGPLIYSISGNSLLLAPAPGDATVTLTYYSKVSPLLNDGDTNVVLEEEYDVYFNAVIRYTYAWLRNEQEEAKYTQKYQISYTKANQQATLRNLGTGGGQSSGYTRALV